ncbi:MAG: hypothetical protein MUO82_00725, partial [Candidatus Thermoplasmatota archaeon]|nr:hypothetical protein [Candidatus Thermoplasmatota archaeon]
MKKNKNFKKLMIFSIAALMCLGILAFLPSASAAPTTRFSDGFEGYLPATPIFPPPGWSISSSASKTWVKYSTYARCNRTTGEASNEWLKTPVINLASYSSVGLEFYGYFYNSTSDTGKSEFKIMGSIDGGATWPYTIVSYTATLSSGTKSFDITSWAAGQSNVKIAWVFQTTVYAGTCYDYVYFNAVKIGTPPFPPAGWAVYNVDGPTTDQWVQYATSPHTGLYDASCYYDVPNNDWIASKGSQYSGIQPFSLWLAKGSTSYLVETCTIYYSTVGNTVANFLANAPLLSVSPPTVAPIYTQYTEGIS